MDRSAPFPSAREDQTPSLQSIKGIGSKRADFLARKGIQTIDALFSFLPIRYEDRRQVQPIHKTGVGKSALIRGRVVLGGEDRFFRAGKRLFRILINDQTAPMELLWFHYKPAHLARFARRGSELFAFGPVQVRQGKRQMIHPELIRVEKGKQKDVLGIRPVYSAIEGVPPKTFRSLMAVALDQHLDALIDPIPGCMVENTDLPGLHEAIRGLHAPPDDSDVDALNRFESPFHRRLIFDRFFRVISEILVRKKSRETWKGAVFTVPHDVMERLRTLLSFSLTGDQKRVIRDIEGDLTRPEPMHRLVQGDVGCGKTVVAAVASHLTVSNNRQVALMAPTQILAQQHFAYFSGLAEKMGFHPVLLSSGLKKSKRADTVEGIKRGRFNLVIGTTALIQTPVTFQRLGLVVIDEQHRFGVRHRALLDRKGVHPNLLVMTATPIPRTLAMTVYADLDLSIIRQYPKGHRPVTTCALGRGQKRKIFDTLKETLSAGEQAIVVCPAIEESEALGLKNVLDMHEKLKAILSPPYRVGLIHGRMPPQEKDDVMSRFRQGAVDVLVGTTVVEVGVHAPGVTLMIIEHPERFGLTQLHQLRGRIGRGARPGRCLLVLPESLPERSRSRLSVFMQSHDGFEIAQKDLEMRGQGEIMGIRQAGSGELDFCDMLREPELLAAAKKSAERLLEEDPDLSKPENKRLRQIILTSRASAPLDV